MADIVYTTTKFNPGFVGVPYEEAIGYTGATQVTAAAVNSGSLPPGLSVNADHTRITGTPTTAGLFTFTLTMTDTGGAVVSGSYSIRIAPAYQEPKDAQTVNDALRIMWPTYGF
jgi:phage baseplate assembly protein gpV